ncbi:hypothetical protein LJC42_05005 [Eubacteriales bacterium OttesenSCG-928-K08]|nr:hypothetical protein [Eubacteriales bacterium OttesenSCG-928-K08]
MINLTATIIFLAIGVIFLIIEMLTPGLGLSGALGIVALFVAIMLQIGNPVGILFMVALVLFLIAVALLVFFRLVNKGSFDRTPMVLKDRIESESTELSEQSMKELPGSVGLALTPLRPAGKAIFDMRTLDVSTMGEFLPSGAKVEVVLVEGLRIVVRSAPEAELTITEEETREPEIFEPEIAGEQMPAQEELQIILDKQPEEAPNAVL